MVNLLTSDFAWKKATRERDGLPKGYCVFAPEKKPVGQEILYEYNTVHGREKEKQASSFRS
jgi:hypothetical protein